MTNRPTHSSEYDGIILGAGHNALILQSYLGLAGLKTISLERRHVAGGGLATEEDPRHPGVLHNTHSFYHRAITQMPWYRDLELERHGASYLQPDLNVVLLRKDGEALEWWTDFEKTFESFSRFSRRDAQVLREWRERFIPIVEKILIPESRSPPIPHERRRSLLETSDEGKLLLEVSAISPLEFVRREFEHPLIQAGLLFFNGLREVDPCCKGFGHHIPALLAASGKAQMCLGGSIQLAHALSSAVQKTGGDIRLRVRLRQIIVENDRAVGVETDDGDFISARYFVVSSLNPQQTFLELLDRSVMPAAWREKAENFKYNVLAPLFALYVTLAEPPHYRAWERAPYLKNALMVILGLEQTDQFLRIIEHHNEGTIPLTVMWGSCPTLFDPSQAPAGRHTAFMWEKLPYRLHGNAANWDSYKETHGREMLSVWQEYAPNLESSCDRLVYS
jgi:phytoene dehydrogenase-like protein